MNSSNNEKMTSIIMIILGIIALMFPMLSTATIGFISGIVVILLAAGLLVAGISELILTKYFGLMYIILAIFCGIFAYYLIFNPVFVSGLIGLMVYIFGILSIAIGVMFFFMGPLSLLGILTILYGFITLIVAYFINDPRILGTVVGVWLLMVGIVSLFTQTNETD